MSINKALSLASFEKYPVWKWDDEQVAHEPVLSWQPIQSDEPTLFIKANFITADGTQLDGYVVGLDTFYAFGIFVDDTEYVFNINLPDMIEINIKSLQKRLDKNELKLFPLEYQTEVNFKNQDTLSGIIDIN